jgi:hypothetical protein
MTPEVTKIVLKIKLFLKNVWIENGQLYYNMVQGSS